MLTLQPVQNDDQEESDADGGESDFSDDGALLVDIQLLRDTQAEVVQLQVPEPSPQQR